MPRQILVIIGHPDPDPARFCRALASAYVEGARTAGHEVRVIDIASLDFPLLRSQAEFEAGPLPPSLAGAAEAVSWASHIVIVFPLWLGTMPALLKGFLEQVIRPGVAFTYPSGDDRGKMLLKGRSARVVVTMGMPGLLYRVWFLNHGIATLTRNILRFVGIGPVRQTLFGMIKTASDTKRRDWLDTMRKLGARGL